MSNDTSSANSWLKTVVFTINRILILAAFVLLPQLIVGVFLGVRGVDLDTFNEGQKLALGLWSSALPALLLVWYVAGLSSKNNEDPFKMLYLSGVASGWFKLTLKAGAIYILLTILANILVTELLPQIDFQQEQELGIDQPSGQLLSVLTFTLLVIITPISEELLFRSFLFGGLLKMMSWVKAGLISALLFGLAHAQLNVGIDVAIMSVVSCWLVHRTQSIVPSIALHGLKNMIAYVLIFGV